MNEIIKHPEFGEIRIEVQDGEPLFCAADVCTALHFAAAPEVLLRKLDDDEKMMRKIYASSKMRDLWFVTESGLYNLIFRSSRPEAKQFRKWVTAEVLPSIRKTGSYAAGGVTAQPVPQMPKPEPPRIVWHDGVACLPAMWLIDNGVMSETNYNQLIKRGRIERVRRCGGLGRSALVSYDSILPRFKKRIVERFGEPVDLPDYEKLAAILADICRIRPHDLRMGLLDKIIEGRLVSIATIPLTATEKLK